MPSSGSGTGAPVVCGVPGAGPTIAQPLKPTLLSLPEYAKMLGINPVHFQGAAGTTVFPVIRNACADVWPRHSWQHSDHLSHEELAETIYTAEEDLAETVGYWPAPYWVAQEVHKMPRHYRPDLWRTGATGNRGQRVSVQTRFGKIIQAGQRDFDFIGTPTVAGSSLVYSDEDSDGFADTATVTVATTLTDECEIKVYHTGTGADRGWEIRPARSKTISGGSFVGVYDAWLFIDPDTQAAYPTTEGWSAVNLDTTANYVTSVDVYREYTNNTEASVTFFWEPRPRMLTVCTCTFCAGTGCPACQLTTQDGCLHVRDPERGVVVPVPSTYDEDDVRWEQVAYTECRDPDMVRLWYLSGDYDNRWLMGEKCEPLSNWWAQTIAWLATARLERPPCSCGNTVALFQKLSRDLAFVGETSHMVDMSLLSNPFGTRYGEVFAWQRVNKVSQRRVTGGAI